MPDRHVLFLGNYPPNTVSLTLAEAIFRRHDQTVVLAYEPPAYVPPTVSLYDPIIDYDHGWTQPFRHVQRVQGLPSSTPLRFAPPSKPLAPRQHKRAAFVRCYQRR